MTNVTFTLEREKESVTPDPANVDGIGDTAYGYDQAGQLLSEGGL